MKKIIAIVVMLALCGCQEQQKQWGKGDPDPQWQGYFGNSNNSRLDFVQSQAIKKLYEVAVNLADKVHALEARPVYDPNEIIQFEVKKAIAAEMAVIAYHEEQAEMKAEFKRQKEEEYQREFNEIMSSYYPGKPTQ